MSFGARLRSKREERDVEVFARDGRLHVDGAAVPFLYAYATDRNAEAEEPNVVRVVDANLRPVFELAVPRSREAEKLIAELGVDELDRPLAFKAGRIVVAPWTAGLLCFIAIFPGIVVGYAVDRLELFYLVFALSVAAVIALYRVPRRMVLNESGFELRDVGRKRRVRWTDLELIDRHGDDGILLRRYDVRRGDGRPAFADPDRMKAGWVTTAEPQENIELHKLGADGREALYRLLVSRRAAARRADEPPPSSEAPAEAAPESTSVVDIKQRLLACAEDDARWWDELAPLVARASYRDPTPSDDALATIVRDVDAALRVRAGASVVLMRREAIRPPLLLAGAVASDVSAALKALDEGWPGELERRAALARLGAVLRSAASAASR